MSTALCELQPELSKKESGGKQATQISRNDHFNNRSKARSLRNFPSPRELASLDEKYLRLK